MRCGDSTDRRRRRSEGAVRRAKAHFWREDPIGGRRLADGFAVGSGERVFTRRVQQANDKQLL